MKSSKSYLSIISFQLSEHCAKVKKKESKEHGLLLPITFKGATKPGPFHFFAISPHSLLQGWRIPSTTYWKPWCEYSELWQTHRLNTDSPVPPSVLPTPALIHLTTFFKMTRWELFTPVGADKSNEQEPLFTCNVEISFWITIPAICWAQPQPQTG